MSHDTAVRIVVLYRPDVLQLLMRRKVLFSFVGNHDPLEIPREDSDPGPVLSLLRSHTPRFDHVVLFLTGGDYVERAQVIKDVASRENLSGTFSFVDIRLRSVVDYEELYETMSAAVVDTRESLPFEGDCAVLLDPGTPQMQTIWFLLVQAGILSARLLQGIPARFGGGIYRYREVRVRPERFPIEMRLRPQPENKGASAGTWPDPAAGTTATLLPVSWSGREEEIVGTSPVMTGLLRHVQQIAPYDELVLITGETGTGKELIARRLHAASERRHGPFTAVNMATLETATAASALFGHCKGAYTGADAQRLGAFRSSENGTLFLDEIGDLSTDLQARILRAIELREIVPLGEDRPRHVNTRVVAATNRDLAAMIREGAFREDLYQRLRQFPLAIPPLRDREDDIELLARFFLDRWNRRYDGTITITDEAITTLRDYRWPGNVRQLENIFTRLCVPRGPDGRITGDTVGTVLGEEEDFYASAGVSGASSSTTSGASSSTTLGAASRAASSATGVTTNQTAHDHPGRYDLATAGPVDLRAILEETERGWYTAALAEAKENQAEAARLLGLNPPAFRKALRDRFPDLLTG